MTLTRIILTSLLSMFFLISTAGNETDSVSIEKLLREASGLNPSDNRMLFFAKKLIGVPYVAHTLDREKEERLIVNTRELDCTTFVETVLSLALCSQRGETSFADYCSQLQQIRYRKGEVAYTSRLHYFTEWIEENAESGFVEKIEHDKPPFTAVQLLKVNYMSRHRSAYPMLISHPQWWKDIEAAEKRLTGRKYRFIPKQAVANTPLVRHTIHDGDIIAILTSKAGLDTSHIGIAVWQEDGLHLLNASQIHRKVVLEPMLFSDYLKKHPSQTGIRVCRMSKQILPPRP